MISNRCLTAWGWAASCAVVLAVGWVGSAKALDDEPLDDVNPGYEIVREAFEKTKTAESVDDFRQIISMCETGLMHTLTPAQSDYAQKLLAWAYNRRGEAYAGAGDEQAARDDFAKAVALDPSHWKAIHNRGVSHAMQGNLAEALADFSRTIELNRTYANAWFNRAELYRQQGDLNRALADYTQALRLNPREAAFYGTRGHALYQAGRVREAMQDYNRAVQLAPEGAGPLVNRADAHREQRAYAQAAADYRRALQLDPKLARAYLGAAWLLATCPDARYRNPEAALQFAQRAIELEGDEDYRYLDTLAAAHANAGQFAEAIDLARRVVELAPAAEKPRYEARLQLYQSQQPYREGVAAPPQPTRTR
jgi:tetratricopeptide (TPR) repeat protein